MAGQRQPACCAAFGRRLLELIEEERGVQLGDHDAWLRKTQAGQPASAAHGEAPAPTTPCAMRFVHTCRYNACAASDCKLCRNNPHKACTAQLRHKYVVGQDLGAPCGATVRLVLGPAAAAGPGGDAAAAQQWAALCASKARVQLLLVDERLRQQRAKQMLLSGASSASNQQVAELLRETTVAFDPAGKPMMSLPRMKAEKDGSLVFKLGDNCAAGVPLGGLSVGCSTERATSGRKRAPVRLAALLLDSEGRPMEGQPALSPEFYVVSDRAENHEASTFLLKDSPISMVRTIGKETVRRLGDLAAACQSSGIRLKLPAALTRVATVGELEQLLQETRTQQAALSQVLKISKAQLESAAAHVATAVEPDGFLRTYLAPGGAALVFPCQQGTCTCAEPAAVLLYGGGEGGEAALAGVQFLRPGQAAEPGGSAALRRLVAQAEAAWATQRHQGWTLLEVGGTKFQTVDELRAALPEEVQREVLPQLGLAQGQEQRDEGEEEQQQQEEQQGEEEQQRRQAQGPSVDGAAGTQAATGAAGAAGSGSAPPNGLLAHGPSPRAVPDPASQALPNPFAQAAGAAPAPAPDPAAARGAGSGGGGSEGLKRGRSSSLGAGAADSQRRAVRQRSSPSVLGATQAQASPALPVEQLSLDSLRSQHVSQAWQPVAVQQAQQQQQALHAQQQQVAQQQQQALQQLQQLQNQHAQQQHQQAADSLQALLQQVQAERFQQQQQQQQPIHRPMPSVPRAVTEDRSLQDRQQLQVLDLLTQLSRQQLAQQALQAPLATTYPTPGHMSLTQSLTLLLAGGTATPGPQPLPSLPTDFWTPSLEQLAQIFTEDASIPVLPVPKQAS